MDEALKQFAKWGVKGVKLDFMNRDDQKMVNFYHRIAKACVEKKLKNLLKKVMDRARNYLIDVIF